MTSSVRSDAHEARKQIDPVTFEVLSHRLWAINDEQATIAARVSGSPVIYEAFDFNSALLSRDGLGLFAGIYIVHHAVPIDMFVSRIREEWRPDEIHEGDMFFTNDPWAGALHANDGILATPIFWEGEIVCWSGIVMHEQDVGSPVPGSFVVGAKERFDEAPLLPPVKMVERFELRRDIEAAFLRNHRTPELNALNLRARMAALRITHRRIHEVIETYGRETFIACQEAIIDHVEKVVRGRLAGMPDGAWFEHTYIDHDGNANELYEIRCSLIKRGERLTLDFAGTAPQAPGPINCARSGLEGASLGVFLIFMCHDLPWSVGAARRIVEIVAEEGTVNNAKSPAATSMASVMGTWATQTVVSNAFAKMLLSSEEFRDEAQASWQPGINCLVLAGLDRNGEPTAGPLMECLGGGAGARTFADGIDTGGAMQSMSSTIPNVETTESRMPVLFVYRRERGDSEGHGRFRGGMGLEFALIPHKNAGPIADIVFATAVSQPEGHGIAGGTPASLASNVVVRGSDVRRTFASQAVPASAEEIGGERQVLAAKEATAIDGDDCHICVVAGGGGYGDPLRREPSRVGLDVARGHVSPGIAHDVYGVMFSDGEVDEAATDELRRIIRRSRLDEGRPMEAVSEETIESGTLLHPVADTVEAVVDDAGGRALRCSECHRKLGDYGSDYKLATMMRELPITALGPLNEAGLVDRIVLHEFSCPGCGTAVAMDVQEAGDPILPEARLHAG